MKPDVSIITPWLDRPEFIADYEAAVRADGVEVIVVDNGSAPDNARLLRAMVDRLGGAYLRNEENRWFSAANNQGMARASGGVLVFLNNDVAGDPGWIDSARREVVAGALFGPSPGEVQAGPRAGAEPLRYIEGWCLAGRREAWAALGGWDARTYPMPYWEDVDLCLRAVAIGLRLVKTDWPLAHRGSGTSRAMPAAARGYRHNRETFFRRLEGQRPADPAPPGAGGTPAPPTEPTEPTGLGGAVDLHRRGRLPDAERVYRRLLAAEPDRAEAVHLLGMVAHESGRHAAAVELMERSIRLAPSVPEFFSNLGGVLAKLGRPHEAVPLFRRAIALAAGAPSASAHSNLAAALAESGRADEALAEAAAALRDDPSCAEARRTQADVLRKAGRLDEALAAARTAVALGPAEAAGHVCLGQVLHDRHDPAGAVAAFEAAVAVFPAHAEARVGRALALLLGGDLVRGFRAYEWRWRSREAPSRGHWAVPPWDGSDPAGRTLLLHCEQGAGDAIQFVRYAPLLARLGARVRVECPPPLAALFAGVEAVEGVEAVRAPGGTPGRPDAPDAQVPLLSLPRVMKTTLDTVPCRVPYLRADPVRVARWREELGPRAGPRVGLAWAGNPGHRNDANRSCPLAAMAPLAAVTGVEFYGVQKGEAAAQVASWPGGRPVVDCSAGLGDYADTAALLACLDLLVCVDTSVAHLAGALARPVWLALPFSPDWRWLLGRSDSPWYPTMRLFRQGRPGDWAGVFDAMAAELRGR